MTLLLLPFVLSLLTFIAIKDDPSVREHDALNIFVFIIFFASSLLFWPFLFSSNKNITFYKRPFLVTLERWWVIFTTKKNFQLDSSYRVLVRREVLYLSDDTCNVYLVNSKNKIRMFDLSNGLDDDFSKLETLLNFTGLSLDPESNIFREVNIVRNTDTGQITVQQKNPLSLTEKIVLVGFFFLLTYAINRFF